MKLAINPVGHNMTELYIGTYVVLFSYETPVAYEDIATGKCYRTTEHFSRTTSYHISKWLDGRKATDVTQDHLYDTITI